MLFVHAFVVDQSRRLVAPPSGKRLMNRALKGHQKLSRPIDSTREALGYSV
jgi:hypothetical protein